MESEQDTEFPATTYQLAEHYQLGQPLALYNMQLRILRFYQVIIHILLGAVICGVVFPLVVIAILFSMYLTLLYQHSPNLSDQIVDLQEKVIFSLPSIVAPLVASGQAMVMRTEIVQKVPRSLLVCTEGVLNIRPKKVDVTRWNEVIGTLREAKRLGKRKRYKLYSINHKPLVFSEVFEDIEGLANLIRQQISQE